MKLFALVVAIASVIGGFVGGALLHKMFSISGAVIGGLVVAIGLLSLGAYFDAQETKKKTEVLPDDVRAIFDRMYGKEPKSSAVKTSPWTPRPFFENHSREDFQEWFAHLPPWNRLDARVIQILIDKLSGSLLFEVFVHVSQDRNLIQHYLPLRSLFEGGVGEFAVCPQISRLLFKAGQLSHESFFKIMNSSSYDEKKAKANYAQAMDAYEVSLHLDPYFLPTYFQMASLKLLIGKKADGMDFCKRGLDAAERLEEVPFEKSELPSIRIARQEIDAIKVQLKSLLNELRT